MQRLKGEDAGFLSQELPIQPMNPVILALLRPAELPDGSPDLITMEYLHEHMARRLGELPCYRWRIEEVPLGLHQPVYIEDPDFDLGYHLRHVTLPAPGGDRELNRFISSLAERRLDRRHPLWQMTLVDGLEDGRQAVVLMYQHCMADGFAAVTTFSRVFSGIDHEVAAPAEPWTPDRVPGRMRLLVDALGDLARTIPGLPAMVVRTVRGFLAVRAHRRRAAVVAPRPYIDTPKCSVNESHVVDRVYTRVSLPLADVKAVKTAAGVTLNDVVLAIVGGAFRRYLLGQGDLPEKPLTATVPAAFEPPDAPPRQFGNRFSGLTASLATDIEDPWKRLQTIAEITNAAKDEFELAGPELLPDWLEFVPPFLARLFTLQVLRRRLKHPEKPDMVNILVSNLRGPQEQWSFGTALIEDLILTGPPSNGVGSNVMLWSYADHLAFGILSFADSMKEPDALGDYLRGSLDELVAAARTRADGPGADRPVDG